MNKKLRTILVMLVLVGAAALAYQHFAERSTRTEVDPAIVRAAAESSRAARQQAPAQEDIPHEGRAHPGGMTSPN